MRGSIQGRDIYAFYLGLPPGYVPVVHLPFSYLYLLKSEYCVPLRFALLYSSHFIFLNSHHSLLSRNKYFRRLEISIVCLEINVCFV